MKIFKLLTAGFVNRVPAGSHFQEYSRTIMRFDNITQLMDHYYQYRGESHSYYTLTSRIIARIMKGTAYIDLAELDKWMGPNYETIITNISHNSLSMQDLRDIVSLVQRRQLFDFNPKHYGQIYKLLQCCIEKLEVEQVPKNEYFLINCIQLAHIANHMDLRDKFMNFLSLSMPLMNFVSTKKIIALSMAHFLPRQMDYRLLAQLHSYFITEDAELANIVLNQLIYLKQKLHLSESFTRWMDQQSESVANSLQTMQMKDIWTVLNRCLAHDIANPICREMFVIFMSQLHPNGELGASPVLFMFIISRMITQSSFYIQVRYPALPQIFISLFKRYFFGREKPVLGLCYRKLVSRTLNEVLFDYNTSRVIRELLEKCGRGNLRNTVLEYVSDISTETAFNAVQMNIQGLFDLHREVTQILKSVQIHSLESLSTLLSKFNQIHPYLRQSNSLKTPKLGNFFNDPARCLNIRLIEFKIRLTLQIMILPEESVMEMIRSCISEIKSRWYYLQCCVLEIVRREWSEYLLTEILLEMSKCNVAPMLFKLLYNDPQQKTTTTMHYFILRYFQQYDKEHMPRVLQNRKLMEYVYIHRQDIFLKHLEHILTYETPVNIKHQLGVINRIIEKYQLLRNPAQMVNKINNVLAKKCAMGGVSEFGGWDVSKSGVCSVRQCLRALYRLDQEGKPPSDPLFLTHIDYLLRNIFSNTEREILLLLLVRLRIYHPLIEMALLFPLLNSTTIISPSQFVRFVSYYPLQRPESMLMNQLNIYLKDVALHLPYAMTIYSSVSNPTDDMQLVIKLLKLKAKRNQFIIDTIVLYDVVSRSQIVHRIHK